MHSRPLRLTAAMLGIAACGSGDGVPPPLVRADVASFTDATQPDVASPDVASPDVPPAPQDVPAADVAMDLYPPGPYGIEVGDTLSDLRLQGFVNPSSMGLASAQPYVETSLGALRGKGRGFALVFIAEFL